MEIFLIAVVALGIFMLGLSITLMRKGRNIQGDVGDNTEMKALGLECALKEGGVSGCNPDTESCQDGSTCGTCDKPTNQRDCAEKEIKK